jgi:hypothetical protein
MEQENTPNLLKNTMTYGAILGIALLIFTLVLYMTGLMFVKSIGYISWIIIIVGTFLAIKNFRTQQEGFITYGRALGVGFLTILFASVIVAFFTYVLYSFIDPGLVEKTVEMARNQMAEKNNLTESQIDAAISISKKLMSPGIMAILTIVSYAFFGIIISLIVAAFMKKENA